MYLFQPREYSHQCDLYLDQLPIALELHGANCNKFPLTNSVVSNSLKWVHGVGNKDCWRNYEQKYFSIFRMTVFIFMAALCLHRSKCTENCENTCAKIILLTCMHLQHLSLTLCYSNESLHVLQQDGSMIPVDEDKPISESEEELRRCVAM